MSEAMDRINPLNMDDYYETYSGDGPAYAHCTQLSSVKGEKGIYTIYLNAMVSSEETHCLGPKLTDWVIGQLEVGAEMTLQEAAQSVLTTADTRRDVTKIHTNALERLKQLDGIPHTSKRSEILTRARDLVQSPAYEQELC